MINSISFKARYLKHTNITKKKGYKGETDRQYMVSVAKLNQNYPKDIKAIEKLDSL